MKCDPRKKYSRISTLPEHILIHNLSPLEKKAGKLSMKIFKENKRNVVLLLKSTRLLLTSISPKRIKLTCLLLPPYSPDLAPSDFYLCEPTNDVIHGKMGFKIMANILLTEMKSLKNHSRRNYIFLKMRLNSVYRMRSVSLNKIILFSKILIC